MRSNKTPPDAAIRKAGTVGGINEEKEDDVKTNNAPERKNILPFFEGLRPRFRVGDIVTPTGEFASEWGDEPLRLVQVTYDHKKQDFTYATQSPNEGMTDEWSEENLRLLERPKSFEEAMQPQVSEGDTGITLLFDGHEWPEHIKPQEMDWQASWWDNGPSPAGNTGPYLKVPHITQETVHRIYFERHRQPSSVSADAVEVVRKVRQVDHENGLVTLEDVHKHAAQFIQAYGDACRLDGARKMQEALQHIRSMMEDAQAVRLSLGDTNKILAICDAALSPETVCGGE